eukprot:m.164677 g.164677  ORF g.164677 m.164677 type:complete len:633 (-) comp12455_c0_seq1:33-1931(-)
MAGDHPVYQTVFLFLALIMVLVLGAWLYWVTSEAYRIRKMQIRLGYKVPTIRSYFSWLFICCTGPLIRRKWEKDNERFRTDDYAPLKRRRPPVRKFLTDGGAWTKLPRGDMHRHAKVIKAALAKVRATVMHDVLDDALTLALAEYSASPQHSRDEQQAAARLRDMASRWQKKAGLNQKTTRRDEVNAMIASCEAEDSSDDDGHGASEWDMGCEVSFLKLAPAAEPKKRQRQASEHPTKRLPNDPRSRPAIQPSTFGNWSDAPAPSDHDAAAGRPAPASKKAFTPMTFGSWGGGGDGDAAGGDVPSSVSEPGDDEPGVAAESQLITPAVSIARVAGSRPVPLGDLKQTVREMTLGSIRSEFDSIDLNRPPTSLLPASARGLTANHRLFPLPHSRVKGADGQYINASYIRGADGYPSKYIATQVPVIPGGGDFGKFPTVNLFWDMVFEHRSTALVLLDDDVAPFWPVELSTPRSYGGVEVTALAMDPHENYTATTLSVARPGGGPKHRVTLFEFRRWDDAMGTASVTALLELSNAVAAVIKRVPSAPMVVLDRDGGDRVGTWIAAEHCFEQIRTLEFVDIMRSVAIVREDRGGLISRPELYLAIYRLAMVYLLGKGVKMNRTNAPPAYTAAPEY